jgi:hypothetical protein
MEGDAHSATPHTRPSCWPLDRITVLSNFIVEMPYSQEYVLSEYLSAIVSAKHDAPLSLGVVGVKELRRTQLKRRLIASWD